MRSRSLVIAVGLIGLTLIGGCGGYATPGEAEEDASMGSDRAAPAAPVAPAGVAVPLAHLPTAVAVVRIRGQVYCSPGWWNQSGPKLSVMNLRDVEKPEQIDRLSALPMVKGIVPISSIMVPENATWADLHAAAAQLHADMLLVYALSSETSVEDALAPLSVATLGLSPNQFADARCTASAVLLDTHNGYVYATMEASDRHQQLASAWTSESAQSFARDKAEEGAFDKLTLQMQATWPNVLKELQKAHAAAGLSD
jgi:hypothetical protein